MPTKSEYIDVTTPAFTRATIIKHRKQWIAALRSGDYKRGIGVLCKSTRTGEPRQYCCLGVVHDIANIPVDGVRKLDDRVSCLTFGRAIHKDTNDSYLTREAQAWLGVTNSVPCIDFPAGHPRTGSSVADLNDSGWTFTKIADAIEQYGFTADCDVLLQRA